MDGQPAYRSAFEAKDRNRFLGPTDKIECILPRLATACPEPSEIDIDVIVAAWDAGVELYISDDGRLQYTGTRGALTDALRDAIKRRRGQIITLLSLPPDRMPLRLFARSDRQVHIESDDYAGSIILAGERATVDTGLFGQGLVVYRGDEILAWLAAYPHARQLIHKTKLEFGGAVIVEKEISDMGLPPRAQAGDGAETEATAA